jgi:hypothetical protein
MKKNSSSESGSFTDIRFNVFYSVCLFVAAIIMTVIFLTVKERSWYYDFFIILAVLFLIHGISALIGSKYVRLDKHGKIVKIYGTFGFVASRYKYDRLFFKDKELYREIEGKTKFINILRYQCRKEDLDAFIDEVNKSS